MIDNCTHLLKKESERDRMYQWIGYYYFYLFTKLKNIYDFFCVKFPNKLIKSVNT